MKISVVGKPLLKKEDFYPHIVVLLFCLGIIAAAMVLQAPQPGDSTAWIGGIPLPSICTFRGLTGWPCPGCGLVRSLTAAVHGEFASSWSFHRLGIITLIYLLLQVIARGIIIGIPRIRKFFMNWARSLDRGLIVIAVLFAVNWVITLLQLWYR